MPPPLHVVVSVFVMALGVVGLLKGRAFILGSDRNPRLDSSRAPRAWPFGKALWQAFCRLPLIGVILCPPGALFYFLDGSEWNGAIVEALWLVTGGCVVLIAFVLIPAVVLFNAPKRLVPPSERHRPGALTMWLDSLRSRVKRQD